MRIGFYDAIRPGMALVLASAIFSQSMGARLTVAQTVPEPVATPVAPLMLPTSLDRSHSGLPMPASPNTPLVVPKSEINGHSLFSAPKSKPEPAAEGLSIDDIARAAFVAQRDRLKPDRMLGPVAHATLDQVQPQQADTYYTNVRGVVTAADTGLPVSNVAVAIYGKSGSRYDTDRTDRLGRFNFSVSRGEYYLRFDPAETYPYYYAPQWYLGQALTDTATLITTTVTVGEPTAVITANAVLTRGAQITGTVLALDTGLPVTNTKIVIFDANDNVVNQLPVDADGRYVSSGLMTGVYRLCAFEDFEFGQTAKFLNGCLEGAPVQSTTLVTVTAPSILPDINLTLVPGAQLSGVVTAADTGAGLADVQVVLQKIDSNDEFANNYFTTNTMPDGKYLLDGLPSGKKYLLYYSTRSSSLPAKNYLGEYYDSKLTASSANFITLTAPLVTVINASLGQGVRVHGRIVAPNTDIPLAGGRIALVPADSNTISELDPTTPLWNYTDDQGMYTVTVRPGQYKIKADSYRVSSTLAYCGKYLDGSLTFAAATSVTVTLTDTQIADITLQPAASVAGNVYRENTTLGIAGARVDLLRITPLEFGDIEVTSSPADATGAYKIGGICNTHYKMQTIAAPPYASSFYPNTYSIDLAQEIPVTRATTTVINPELSLAGLISGRITSDKTGLPLARASVVALQLNSVGQYFTSIEQATNFDGRYQIWVAPGIYYLFVRNYSDGFASSRYCGEWYAGIGSVGNPIPLIVRSQEHLRDLDLALTSGTIRGTLREGETGLPLPNVYVQAYPTNQFDQFSLTDSRGIFELTGLCRGQYVLRYSPSTTISPTGQYPAVYSGNSPTLEGAATVNIRNSEVVTFEDTLQRGVPLTVTVLVSATSKSPDYRSVEIWDERGNFVANDNAFPFENAAQGLLLPKGRYVVRAASDDASPRYAPGYYDGKPQFAEANVLDLTTTNPISNITMRLQPGSVITGRVVDADTQRGLYGVSVNALESQFQRRIAAFAYTDSSGYFTTSASLAPGEYVLWFVLDGHLPLYLGGALVAAESTPITITAGITATVSMALPRLNSPTRFNRKVYMPIVPAERAPVVVFAPTITPLPPTATPRPVATLPPISGTLVLSGTFPSGTVGRSILYSNYVQISDVQVQGDASFNEGDEYIDLLNTNASQTVNMSNWRIRINGVALYYIPGNAATSQNFALPPAQGCRIYTGNVSVQQVPSPYNWCGVQSFSVTTSSIGLYTNDHGTVEILDENSVVVASFTY